MRAYLAGDRVVGQRAATGEDRFEPFVAHCRSRLTDDPHLWATTLYDELLQLGFPGSYPTLTRQLRDREPRPTCQACSHVKDRAAAIINHPPQDRSVAAVTQRFIDEKAPGEDGATSHCLLLVSLAIFSEQDRLMLLTLIRTAGRFGEIASIRPDRLDPSTSSIFVDENWKRTQDKVQVPGRRRRDGGTTVERSKWELKPLKPGEVRGLLIPAPVTAALIRLA